MTTTDSRTWSVRSARPSSPTLAGSLRRWPGCSPRTRSIRPSPSAVPEGWTCRERSPWSPTGAVRKADRAALCRHGPIAVEELLARNCCAPSTPTPRRCLARSSWQLRGRRFTAEPVSSEPPARSPAAADVYAHHGAAAVTLLVLAARSRVLLAQRMEEEPHRAARRGTGGLGTRGKSDPGGRAARGPIPRTRPSWWSARPPPGCWAAGPGLGPAADQRARPVGSPSTRRSAWMLATQAWLRTHRLFEPGR